MSILTHDSSTSQLNSYLLCMSYSDCEVWAGDITGKLHSFSMRDGTLKAMSQIDVGHTALITGIHRSPGSLYTCSSDRTVKVHVLFFYYFSAAPSLDVLSACCHWLCSRYTSHAGLQGHCARCSTTLQSLGSVSAHVLILFQMLKHWGCMLVKAVFFIVIYIITQKMNKDLVKVDLPSSFIIYQTLNVFRKHNI